MPKKGKKPAALTGLPSASSTEVAEDGPKSATSARRCGGSPEPGCDRLSSDRYTTPSSTYHPGDLDCNTRYGNPACDPFSRLCGRLSEAASNRMKPTDMSGGGSEQNKKRLELQELGLDTLFGLDGYPERFFDCAACKRCLESMEIVQGAGQEASDTPTPVASEVKEDHVMCPDAYPPYKSDGRGELTAL